ncbi:MobA/MobL family protein [Glaesserella parasuis]|uniref:MobA/L n=6 Tax=Glaesserella parasuis TaxID=738 RepID=A0A0G3EKB6_GLAPU|nr:MULTISPECIES: MobA/MobL family protein [Gammaproteobacteria]QOF66720.1 MobA/MobL family protein [Actinobacillus sp. GY-402]AKJ66277.1 MobA/L [Glaesserella parasuis]MDG6228265.1 MobA/MobL family protein [Glaesserella parasuis]MDG6234193.1 MobA/MobL family protein [Glaesserella parasuis]MDG6253754.1 MobA/MobL family protein [Glaesserella parasuis]
MAIYHLNVRYCSKSKGQSAQAKNEYINRNDKYSKRLDDLQFSGFGNMPKFAENNPQKFWQASDIYERANARVCTEIVFALPRELNLEQQQELVQSFINSTVNSERNKLPYSFAIHNDKANNNPHCHLIFSERQLDGIERSEEQFFKRANSKNAELGGTKKTADFRDRDFIKAVRKTWSEQANFALEKHGHTARIDERSYQEQGIDKEPRARLDRVTWQELQRLEENAEFFAEVIERKQNQIEQEKVEITKNTPKNTLEPFSQKDDIKHEQIKKVAENRKESVSQAEFDRFLIENWLEPNQKFINACEKRAKMRSEWEQYGKDLERINSDYKALNEKKQGLFGLWETKEQKQTKQELESEYYRIKALRKEKAEEHDTYNDKINQYEKDTIEPLRKQIEQMKADNPHLEQRNHQQLMAMKFKGLEQWAKDKLQREQSQKRQISHSKDSDLSL